VTVKLQDAEAQNFGKSDDMVNLVTGTLEFPIPYDPRALEIDPTIQLEVMHPRFQTAEVAARAPTRAEAAPRIQLERGFPVTGQVFDVQGQPIADALVQVREPKWGWVLADCFTTRENGMFSTPFVLKPGKYTVVVQSPDYAATWRTVLVGEVLASHQFLLQPGQYISGKVVDQSAKPVPGAALGRVRRLQGQGGDELKDDLSAMTATDTDGKFRLGPLPPGEFKITAIAESPRRLGSAIVKAGEATVITVRPE
jgi:hypothetical protein